LLSNKDNASLSPSNLEQDIGNESLAEKEAERLNPRFNITVTSYRKRKHDPDGISAKAVLDGLVRRGLLKDDSTSEVNQITFKSEITKGDEKTIVVLESTTNANSGL